MTGSLYAGTLFRYACLAAALVAAMVLLYRLLLRMRCGDATAAGFSFILPWVVGFTVFSAFPMLLSLLLSFTRYQVLSAPKWAGLDNYARLFADDPAFRDAVWNTAAFAVLSVTLGVVSSLLAALLLSMKARLMGLWRAIYYIPSVVPAVSTALLWRWIFVPEGGLANTILGWMGVPASWQPRWFGDPSWVIPAFVIMGLQGAFGNNMVIFLARLRGIDVQLHESAALDGAGTLARFVHITLPQLSPIVFYHVVMGIIGSLQIFTQPMFVETPGRSGLFYAPYVYRTGLQEYRMGYACALSWVLFAALMLVTLIVFRSSRRWVSYEQSEHLARTSSPVTTPTGWRRRLWYALVVTGALVMLVPMLWMVATSLKSSESVQRVPPEVLSFSLNWSNYAEAWTALPVSFTRFLLNTLFVTALAVFGQVLVSTLVAYGFARFRFPGRRILFAVLLSTLMIPGVVMMIPVFLIWKKAGLVGTFDPLVLGSMLGGSALMVFIAHQFFKTLPRELEEAARLDGASHGRIFLQVILPVARGVFLVLVLIAFQTHWNDFLGPLLYLNRLEQYTMTLGLHFFQGYEMGEGPKWNYMMAITTLMAVPTVVIFALTQATFFEALRRRTPVGPQ